MWFTAALLFKSVHAAVPDDESVWEERIVIFSAPEEEEAMTKALAYGKEAEHRYRNNAGEEIEWKFDTVEILCRLEAESLADGLEVISRFLKQSEVISLKTPFEA